LGLPKYRTGKPCSRGHVEDRYATSGVCVGCQRAAQSEYRKKPIAKVVARDYYERRRRDEAETIMWNSARRRAAKFGVPFDISPSDILKVWPGDGLCPVLGIPLRRNYDGNGGNAKDSPSLDRVRPEFGYVKGNIAVISQKANLLKGDETDPAVFRRLADWIERVKGN